MPPFRFRLEQVRRYRKQLEEQAMQVMALAVMQRDATMARIHSIREELEEQHILLSSAASLSPAELWLARTYESALQQDLATAERLLSKQEDAVDQARQVLVERAKDRGLLDSLKEKQAARHARLEREQEQKTNDETATLRYKPATV